MNRTWTEISWFEWGGIALVGGIIFVRYDKSVTPLLMTAIENHIGNYLAGKITGALASTVVAGKGALVSAASGTKDLPLQKDATVQNLAAPQLLPPTGKDKKD